MMPTRLTIFAVLLGTASLAWAKADKPNLVIVLTDDQGYADVGFNGCTDIPTPNIDRIAASGVKFTDGYVSFPVCGPSRAGLLTGRYQNRFGFTTNPTIDPSIPEAGIPQNEENMAEVLKKAGIIKHDARKVKIINTGEVGRAVTIKGLAVTKGAQAAIEAAGGKVE